MGVCEIVYTERCARCSSRLFHLWFHCRILISATRGFGASEASALSMAKLCQYHQSLSLTLSPFRDWIFWTNSHCFLTANQASIRSSFQIIASYSRSSSKNVWRISRKILASFRSVNPLKHAAGETNRSGGFFSRMALLRIHKATSGSVRHQLVFGHP